MTQPPQRSDAGPVPAIDAAAIAAEEGADWPLTIGVALPIPEPFLSELGAYRERFGDPLAHAIVAHITLVPPMVVGDVEHLDAVLAHLAVVARGLRPFPLVLAGSESFRPVSPVVFVPIEEGEADVRSIEAEVRCGPLDRPLVFPFHPHVTVAHDVADEWLDEAESAMAGYRAAFEMASLGLFAQGADGIWRQRVEVPFGG